MKRLFVLIALALCALHSPAWCDDDGKDNGNDERPFVAKGIYDKPFITSVRQARFGGYIDAQFRHLREDGLISETTFKLERINLFAFAPVSSRVRLAMELEFEDGGEEVKIELAILDIELHRAATFRAGMLLTPIGRFNLAHDSPANELTDRPLVSTEILGTTLSEPGMGFYGAMYPGGGHRITYEAYLVNGFNDGVINGSADEENRGGTFIPAGRGNFEDNNNHPSAAGRLTWSPATWGEIGVSGHTGPYNAWKLDGVANDERRDLTLLALDWDANWHQFRLTGEWAHASIDIPASLAGINQETQGGYYVEAGVMFLENRFDAFEHSSFMGTIRFDDIDFDRDGDGDDHRRLTLGLNFRIAYDTLVKLDYQYNWERDPFLNEGRSAGILFSVASYF